MVEYRVAMLRSRSFAVSFLTALVASSCVECLAFSMKRSGIPAVWDTAPSLEADQRSFDRILDGKIQVTGMDKVLQTSDTNKSAKRVERSDAILENADMEGSPRNAVLLLIETGQDPEDLWENFTFAHSFPVQGYLRTCRDADGDETRFSLDAALTGEKRDKDCECEQLLRSSVASLLSWARHDREMTTGSVSVANFSIPPFGEKMLEEDEIALKPEVLEIKQEPAIAWHPIDSNKSSNSAALLAPTTVNRDGASLENMRDAMDVFSRIRVEFFRTLLESLLAGRSSGSVAEASRRDASAGRAGFVGLIGDTMRELVSVANDKGYVLVAVAPGTELFSAYDLLQREISPRDTLLVVAGICSGNWNDVPYFARGPSAKLVHEARAVWELPGALKGAVSAGCHGPNCRTRRSEDVAVGLSPVRIAADEIGRKRVARNDDGDKKSEQDSAKKNETASEADSSEESTSVGRDPRTSGALGKATEGVATVLGILTSIVAATTLSRS